MEDIDDKYGCAVRGMKSEEEEMHEAWVRRCTGERGMGEEGITTQTWHCTVNTVILHNQLTNNQD